MNDLMSLVLDLANIAGGFLLAIALLRQLPKVGDDLGRWASSLAPFAWIVGVIALAVGGYFLLNHLISGPHVFHFEVVGIGVGVALLWDRLRASSGRSGAGPAGVGPAGAPGEVGGGTTTGTLTGTPTGVALLLAVFGIIAIAVGLQGIFTSN